MEGRAVRDLGREGEGKEEAMGGLRRVDAHQHFWRYGSDGYGWIGEGMEALKRDFLPDGLRLELDGQGVYGTVAVQARSSEAETDFLLGLAAAHPWILAVVGWIDLRAGDLEARLEARAASAILKGYRHPVQDEPSPSAFLEDGRFNRGVEALQRRGKVYEVLVRSGDLPAAVAFCGRHDRGPLVLDHLGKPDVRNGSAAAWRGRVKPLAALEHVSCKLSGLITEAEWRAWDGRDLLPYLDAALECFGPERLLFGSDWPVCLLSGTYAQVRGLAEAATASLSESEREAVWGGNACRVYGLNL